MGLNADQSLRTSFLLRGEEKKKEGGKRSKTANRHGTTQPKRRRGAKTALLTAIPANEERSGREEKRKGKSA